MRIAFGTDETHGADRRGPGSRGGGEPRSGRPRLTSPEVAREMLDAFLTTDRDPDEREQIAKLG